MSSSIQTDMHCPIEHHYTLDKNGRPIEIDSVIYISPNNIQQLSGNTIPEYQLDMFFDLMKSIDDKDIKRIVRIIDALPESFRKQTKKLFAEIGELKKKNLKIQQKNENLQKQIDFLYETLNIEKREFDEICNFF